jgi:hypothetical protein
MTLPRPPRIPRGIAIRTTLQAAASEPADATDSDIMRQGSAVKPLQLRLFANFWELAHMRNRSARGERNQRPAKIPISR